MNLFLRDFDEENTQNQGVTLNAEGVEPVHLYSQDDVDQMLTAAHKQGLEEGHAVGMEAARAEAEASLSARANDSLAALQHQLSELLTQERARQAEMERELVTLVTDIGEALTPELLRQLGPELVSAKLREGLHMARGSATLRLRLAPDLAEHLGPQITALAAEEVETAALDIVPDETMSGSATRLSWHSGALTYDLQKSCEAILDMLRGAAAQMNEDMGKA